MDPVTITLSDGKERVLRYSLATSKRVSKAIGKSLLQIGIGDIDESKFGLILWYGLHDKANPPADIPTAEAIDELIDMAQFIPLMKAFNSAWIMANAPKNAVGDQSGKPAPEQPTLVN